jgi:hypothetical protein
MRERKDKHRMPTKKVTMKMKLMRAIWSLSRVPPFLKSINCNINLEKLIKAKNLLQINSLPNFSKMLNLLIYQLFSKSCLVS